jgi:hypothetical protein
LVNCPGRTRFFWILIAFPFGAQIANQSTPASEAFDGGTYQASSEIKKIGRTTAMTTHQDIFDSRRSVRIQGMLDDLIRQVWRDIEKANEPKAQALFEKTAEVLGDLKTAYERYDAEVSAHS